MSNTLHPSPLERMGHLAIPLQSSPYQSKNNSTQSVNKIDHDLGYSETVFEGKAAQQAKVVNILTEQGFIPADLVSHEVEWFYEHTGIEDVYFSMEDPETIASHVLNLYSAKIQSFIQGDPDSLVIDLEQETEKACVYIHSSKPGISVTVGPGALTERKIDAKFLNGSETAPWRVESFRSESQDLRSYFVTPCSYPNAANIKESENVDEKGKCTYRIKDLSDPTFLSKASANTLEIYQRMIRIVEDRNGQGPVIELFQVEGKRQYRLVVGYKRGTTTNFFSSLTDLYHFYGLYSSRKYVENFSNGTTILCLYLGQKPDSRGPPIENAVVQIMKEVSLMFVLPANVFFGGNPDAPQGTSHAVQEAAYAQAGWIFVTHFANRLGPAYSALQKVLDEKNSEEAAVLNDIKKRFREETFTRQSIFDAIVAYPEIVRALYTSFAMRHYPSGGVEQNLMPTLSYARLQTHQVLTDDQILDKIRRTTANEHESQILQAFLVFNRAILKTNFYQHTKIALSFRLDPSFLPKGEYPSTPYGVFMVFGQDFRGFHVRFKDVARGGLRVVKSRNREAWAANVRSLFDENYGLASTQALKNKDIPEGGAKGIILPNLDANHDLCFMKYIDGLLDLLLPGQTAGIKEPIVDLLGKQEILFFGPDENTAHLMDRAALHAKSRGATWWKSATTGKSAEKLGGIPHDTYGMTSLSIRQYYVGSLAKLNLKEEEVTKVMAGGPDGDLGSNEILLSKDKTIAVIDGSGVLHDPTGIDRTELIRLARLRKPISSFDITKLGQKGYRILCEDTDVTLPDGENVADGTTFRNNAHFRYKADVFIPCGGRPEAINISNVGRIFDQDGKPHFRILVEGANLFVTQSARLLLEKRGVVLYRDSSANKGGVTSSSLEVLAGLGLTEQEYLDLMVFKDGKSSDFYKSYAKDIQNIITRNAALEFECIHAEYERNNGNTARTIISDTLSLKLIDLQNELETSDLMNNDKCKRAVLSKAIPPTLLAKVGLDALLTRLPEPYLKALFASRVASTFIYLHGIQASQVAFFHYMIELSE